MYGNVELSLCLSNLNSLVASALRSLGKIIIFLDINIKRLRTVPRKPSDCY